MMHQDIKWNTSSLSHTYTFISICVSFACEIQIDFFFLISGAINSDLTAYIQMLIATNFSTNTNSQVMWWKTKIRTISTKSSFRFESYSIRCSFAGEDFLQQFCDFWKIIRIFDFCFTKFDLNELNLIETIPNIAKSEWIVFVFCGRFTFKAETKAFEAKKRQNQLILIKTKFYEKCQVFGTRFLFLDTTSHPLRHHSIEFYF